MDISHAAGLITRQPLRSALTHGHRNSVDRICTRASQSIFSSVVVAASRDNSKKKSGGGKSTKPKNNKQIKAQGAASAKKPKQPDAAVQESQRVTGPLQVQTLEQLTSVESQPVPLWDSFCGAIGGYWQGSMAAYHPDTGKPEEVALSSEGKKLFDMQTILETKRLENGSIERRFQMAEMKEELQIEKGDSSIDDEEWDTDNIEEEEEGLAIFDGGGYSRGPLRLGILESSTTTSRTSDHALDSRVSTSELSNTSEASVRQTSSSNGSAVAGRSITHGMPIVLPDTEEDDQTGEAEEEETGLTEDDLEPFQTVVIEQCIAWGGELRVRLQITLAIAELWEGDELDLEVLRVVVFREAWECLSDDAACSLEDMIAPQSSSPTIPKDKVVGEYKVFDISAVPVEETDSFTGETKQLMLHYSQETQQAWAAPAAAPEDGAALWLPGQLLLQLRMIPAASRGTEADVSEGVDLTAPCGFLISAGWAASDGVMSLVEREYDGMGFLTEVRARTAVRGGWIGGSM